LVDTTWTTQHLTNIVDFADNDIHLAVRDTNSVSQLYIADAPQGLWHPVGRTLPNAVKVGMTLQHGDTTIVLGLGDSNQGSGGLVVSVLPTDTVPWPAPVSAAGIGGNDIESLGMDPEGHLWVGGGGFTSGVYVRRGDSWTNFTRSTGYQQPFFGAHPTSFAFDDFGGTWAGSSGSGLAWFHGGDSITFINDYPWDTGGFAQVGGALVPRVTGINDDPDRGLYYIETYVARDAAGDVFISNLEARNGLAVTVASRDWIAAGNNRAPWPYFLPRIGSQVLTDYYASGRLLVDPLQRTWIGPGRNSAHMYVLDTRGTLADTLDDTWSAFAPNSRKDNVTCFDTLSAEVLDWTMDQQGYLWVGTRTGAYYTQGGVPEDPGQVRFICVADLPVGVRVNAVHVDAQDNKWFGTDDGVAVLDKNFNWIYVFQTANSVDHPSDLISNNVLSITSNPATGEIWVGTADGLSRFTSAFAGPSSGTRNTLFAYPDPFRADGAQHMRVGTGVDLPRSLGGRFDDFRVLTISGRLVRKLDWTIMTDPGSGGGWDGRNDKGDLVAGGVYLLVASTNDGKSAVGKVAVLGR